MKNNKCVFVIIGFNNYDLTDSMIKNFKQVIKKYPLWLYDNDSKPSLKKLAQKYQLPYYRSPENLGFSGGANKIIEWVINESKSDIVCLLNNDILVNKDFSQNLDQELLKFIKNKKTAAMTPQLYLDEEYKRVENFGVYYYQSGLAFQNRVNKNDNRVLLNGAFLFIKTSVCKKLINEQGYVFQPFFFFNAEDVELSLKLVQRGYKIKVSEILKARHLGNQSLGPVSRMGLFYSWRNLLFTLVITRPIKDLLLQSPLIVGGQIIQFLFSLKNGYFSLFFSVYKSFLMHRGQLITARKNNFYYKKTADTNIIHSGIFPLHLLKKIL